MGSLTEKDLQEWPERLRRLADWFDRVQAGEFVVDPADWKGSTEAQDDLRELADLLEVPVVTAEDTRKLHEATGATMLTCKMFLEGCDGDFERARHEIVTTGLASSAVRNG